MFMLVPPGAGNGANYQIKNSLRFNSADSAYMSRTQGTAGNRTTWTLSMWVKRCALSGAATYTLLESGTGTQPYTVLAFMNDTIQWDEIVPTNSVVARKFTTPVLRDPASWYHLVFCWDSGNATATDRQRIYINGSRVTTFASTTDPALSATSQFNGATVTNVGALLGGGTGLDAYLSEVNFIDGQALTPSSFGKSDSVTGQWVAKKYNGTYGTYGFYLPFNDNTSTTTLGYDRSGNSNNWTLTNFNVTAGVNNDWMQDTPTNNYCTLNLLRTSVATISDGSLKYAVGAGNSANTATYAVSSGQWYWEANIVTDTAGYTQLGIAGSSVTTNPPNPGYEYISSGNKRTNGGSLVAYGATYAANDVIGVALDLGAGTLEFYKNGVSQGVAYTGITGEFMPYVGMSSGGGSSGYLNFGQRGFAYTPPTGFKSLCTKNLSVPNIKNGSKYFDAVTWSGDNTASRTLPLNFQPDFVWGKARNTSARGYLLFDSARGFGSGKELVTNANVAEGGGGSATYGYVSGVTANGFTVANGTTDNSDLNATGTTYVSWNWRQSVTSGFAVITYTGDGTTNRAIAHSLGVAPKFCVTKRRDSTGDFVVRTFASGTNQYGYLDTTAAFGTAGEPSATSTTFYVSGGADNVSGGTYVAYLFAEVASFSKIGLYTGNGSTDGPFVYCGFKPRYLLIKRTDAVNDWYIFDTARDSFNVASGVLVPDTANAETITAAFDFLSNGFKIRQSGTGLNASGGTYFFVAFAHAPFKYGTAK